MHRNSRLVAALLAVFVLVPVASSTAAADTVSGGSTSSYYRLRPDPRDCASPMCGGVFVSLVNRRSTVCPVTGMSARECYVPAVAYRDQLGADAATFAAFKSEVEGGRGLLRGRLTAALVGGQRHNRLVASEGWRASSGGPSQPSGAYRLLEFSGMLCVTTPCFNVHASALNSHLHDDVSDVDLARAGASEKEQLAANEAIMRPPPGVIAAGSMERAGDGGVVFAAAQFYRQLGT